MFNSYLELPEGRAFFIPLSINQISIQYAQVAKLLEKGADPMLQVRDHRSKKEHHWLSKSYKRTPSENIGIYWDYTINYIYIYIWIVRTSVFRSLSDLLIKVKTIHPFHSTGL